MALLITKEKSLNNRTESVFHTNQLMQLNMI